MTTRRQVLASAGGLGGVTALAGCPLYTGNDSSMAIYIEDVSREDLGQNYVVAADELEPRARAVVREGLSNGTIVHGTKPIRSDEIVLLDGSYYAVQITENGTETVTRPVLDATEVASADGTAADWGNLSESDALTLRCAVSTRDERDAPPCVVFAGNDSAFWPDLRFRYFEGGDETYYRLHASEQRVTLDRYDYTFDLVASSRSAFAEYAESELVAINFATIDLSAEQQDILDTAADDGIYRESPPPYSEDLRDLVERLRAANGNAESSVYIRFDGNYFVARYSQTFN